MTKINNVTRLLDARKVSYTAFVLPPEKLGTLKTAEILGVASSLVFKTLVALRPAGGKSILAVIPGDRELDLKALARAVKEKKVRLATQAQAEALTGLLTGGISPLALINRGFQVVIDDSAKALPHIHLSGGQRGLNIQLSPHDLAKLTQASFHPLST